MKVKNSPHLSNNHLWEIKGIWKGERVTYTPFLAFLVETGFWRTPQKRIVWKPPVLLTATQSSNNLETCFSRLLSWCINQFPSSYFKRKYMGKSKRFIHCESRLWDLMDLCAGARHRSPLYYRIIKYYGTHNHFCQNNILTGRRPA